MIAVSATMLSHSRPDCYGSERFPSKILLSPQPSLLRETSYGGYNSPVKSFIPSPKKVRFADINLSKPVSSLKPTKKNLDSSVSSLKKSKKAPEIFVKSLSKSTRSSKSGSSVTASPTKLKKKSIDSAFLSPNKSKKPLETPDSPIKSPSKSNRSPKSPGEKAKSRSPKSPKKKPRSPSKSSRLPKYSEKESKRPKSPSKKSKSPSKSSRCSKKLSTKLKSVPVPFNAEEDRLEREILEAEVDELQARLALVKAQTEKAVKEEKEKLQRENEEKKRAFLTKARRRSAARSYKNNLSCIEDNKDLIKSLREENSQVRRQNQSLLEDCRNLRMNNERIEKATEESWDCYRRLKDHHAILAAQNEKLAAVESAYKKKLDEVTANFNQMNAESNFEHVARKGYERLLDNILSVLEDRCADHELVSNVRESAEFMKEDSPNYK